MDAVQPWLNGEDGDRVAELMRQAEWLGRKLYQDYEPNEYESFDERFGKWVANVDSDRDRRSLFNLLDHIFFVGRREFEALCRAAYNGEILRWIIDRVDAPIDAPDTNEIIREAVGRTWFCPITDSMRINAFLKVNQLEGQSHRPDWRSLARFADPEKVRRYMDASKLDRVVLLEDFVGSGTQMKSAAEFAAETSDRVPFLIVPLICCPKGVEVGERLKAEYANFHFSPVLEISDRLLLREEPREGEPAAFSEARSLTLNVRDRFDARNAAEPFGFKSTGALVVMYSNCPNNTVALIHNESEHWKALFPRIQRSA
jgi:hypothetical protein